MLNTVPREFVVLAGLLAVPAVAGVPTQPQPAPVKKNDPRLSRLREFFAARAHPLRNLEADFVAAADRNGLDWRLLPSISIIESGGGRDYRNNNIFGWNSGNDSFPSIRAAIHTIAAKLATSKLYRNKDLDQILKTYNSRPEYAVRVKAIMLTIGAQDLAAAVAALN